MFPDISETLALGHMSRGDNVSLQDTDFDYLGAQQGSALKSCRFYPSYRIRHGRKHNRTASPPKRL
jgi:hypothetical protein